MRGSTHAVVGVACGVAVAHLSFMPQGLPYIVCAVVGGIGGLIPDIDHAQSKLGRKALPVSVAVQTVFGHRTITHSLTFWLVIGILGLFANLRAITLPITANTVVYLFDSFYLGALLHIFCDMLTVQGVPLFYPIMTRFRVPLMWRAVAIVEPLVMFLSTLFIYQFGIAIPLGL